MSGPDASVIASMLRERIEDLAAVVYPEGRLQRTGGAPEWRVGRKGSVAVKLGGRDRGLWSDFEQNEHGDPLDMVAHVLFAGDKKRAFAWARDWLGVARGAPGQWREATVKAKAARERAAQRTQGEAARARDDAAAYWLGSQPSIEGTLAETYLRARAIDLARLPKVPAALRFKPDATCHEDDLHWKSEGRPRPARPAMVAAMWAPGDRLPRAVQRTFLASDGAAKAPLRNARMTLGSWPGALCPISRGPTGRRVKDMQEGEEVAIGEGLEEGLSIALARPEWRVFACMYVANFALVKLPVRVKLMLCPNNDRADSPAAEAFRKAVYAQRAEGHAVRVLRAPEPHKDWNDFLRSVS